MPCQCCRRKSASREKSIWPIAKIVANSTMLTLIRLRDGQPWTAANFLSSHSVQAISSPSPFVVSWANIHTVWCTSSGYCYSCCQARKPYRPKIQIWALPELRFHKSGSSNYMILRCSIRNSCDLHRVRLKCSSYGFLPISQKRLGILTQIFAHLCDLTTYVYKPNKICLSSTIAKLNFLARPLSDFRAFQNVCMENLLIRWLP